MCDSDDFDSATDLRRGWVRARKQHRCYACREAIRPGDRYHEWVSKQEGELDTARHCARCYLLMEALWASGAEAVDWSLDCGVSYEEVFGPIPEHVARLAFMTPDEAQAAARKPDAPSTETA